MNVRLIGSKFFPLTRVAIISLCLALPWTGAFVPRACFGLDAAEMAAGADQPDQELRSSAGIMRIYAIDVGQGDSALVVFPDSSNMLIDAGPSARNIKSLLGRLGITKLNKIILTHADSDHTGGYSSLQSGGYIDGSTQRYDWTNTSPGQYFYNNNAGASVLCVTSAGHIIGGAYVAPKSDNDMCVGAIVKFRGFDYLTCGDIEWGGSYLDVEDPLGVALHNRGDHIDVYKVDHHGSKYGSSLNFLKNMMPEFAVIMVGDNNSYGHPTQEAINRLNDPTVHVQRIFQTETGAGGTASNVTVANGQVVITTDGATYTFANEGPGSNPFNYGPYNVDEYVTPEAPHLMVAEAAISGSYLSPENHRWVELYLPPSAPSIDLSTLYWVSKDHKGQLAKDGPLTMIPGDIAITHMTQASDTVYIDESDNTGKGANGWWDVYTHLDGNYWVTTEDLFMISRENSLMPNPLNIFDVVVWSNSDGTAAKTQSILDALNYPIKIFHWGDPIAGSGLFSSTNDSPGVGNINSGYAQRICTIDTDSKGDWQISPINSEGTPPPEPTPLPTPPPIIDLIPNKSTFSRTDRIEVNANVQPISTPCYPFIRFLMPDGTTLYFERGVGFRTSPTPYLGLPLRAITVPSAITNFPALSAGFTGLAPGTYIMEGGAVDATLTTSVKNLIYVDGIDRETLIVQ
jgi:competence protein ComEC